MKKIRILLDYGSYPVWVYDEAEQLINFTSEGFQLPDEINTPETRQLCEAIQSAYHSLFTNNERVFSYNGFGDRREEERDFINKLKRLVNIVIERLGGAYHIINDIEEDWQS